MGQIPRSTVLVDYKVWSLLREQVNKVKSQQYRWATPTGLDEFDLGIIDKAIK